MNLKSIILTLIIVFVFTVSTVAAAAGTQQELSTRNDHGRPIVLYGSDRFEVAWQVPIPREEISALNHPFLRDDEGNVYIWTLSEIVSIDVNGSIRWKHEFASHGGKSWALIMGKDGTVFGVQCAEYKNGAITDNAGYIVALKKDTGQLLWDHVMAKPFSTNSATNYSGAGGEEGNLILETGAGIVSIGPNGVNWSYRELYPEGTAAMQSGLTLDTSGNVYAFTLPASSGTLGYSSLFCLDRYGKLLWKQDHAVGDGVVWMKLRALPDGELYGVNFYDIYKWDAPQKKFTRVEKASAELMDELHVPNDEHGALYRGNEKTDQQLHRIWYYPKEDGYFYVSIYTQSDDQGNVYFTDSGGNLFSLDPDGNERFVLKSNDSNMSEFPFLVTKDGTVFGYSVDLGVFRLGEKGNPIKIYVDGNRLTVPVNPEIKNGNTRVPLRAIFEALGADVAWNAQERSISVTQNNTNLYLEIGSMTAKVNGTSTSLEAAPEIVNSTTMVPLRFVSEALGSEVEWDAANRVVRIQMTSK